MYVKHVPFDWRRLLPLLVVIVGVAAYANSFSGVFVLDDEIHIRNNARIRTMWPPWQILSGQRPIVDLTLAINYEINQASEVDEFDPWGYHLVNLIVHVLAGLTLFGVVRRTVLHTDAQEDVKRAAPWLALVIAIIWTVHPLQTQSVTYLIQRAESMMGLFYLLTLYCVIRGAESSRGVAWYVAAVIACALGTGSKGVMVTAPVVVLLYDRFFLSGSFGHIVRRRWHWYCACLLATWGGLFATGMARGVFDRSNHGATVGFGYHGITPSEYLLTQTGVIAYYLKLSLWPAKLCLDYAWPVARTLREVALPALIVGPLLVATVWALVRRSWVGFAGAWFFLILAPTSSIIPIKDPLFEHRMYLPLAAVVSVVVIGAFAARRRVRRGTSPLARAWSRLVVVAATVTMVALLTGATIQRNRDYHDDLTMWRDVLAKRPGNPRGHLGQGTTLFARGQIAASEEAFRRAIELKPNYADAHYNLGNALREQGRYVEAADAYRQCLHYDPRHARAFYNFGNALKQLERYDEAVDAYRSAVLVKPDHLSAWINLGNTLTLVNRLDDAVEAYHAALRINPRYANAHDNLARALQAQGKLEEAREHYRLAAECDPKHAGARRAYEALRAEPASSPGTREPG